MESNHDDLSVEDKEKLDALEEAFREAALMEGDGIFTSNEAAEGLKKAAEDLGIDPDTVDVNKPRNVLYAKENCKSCFGRGVVVFLPSPAKPKKLKVPASVKFALKTRKGRKRKIKGKMRNLPTQKRARSVVELKGNKLGTVWNTCQPEPMELKVEMLQHRPCKCVRVLEM